MKKIIKKILTQAGLYYPLKYSFFFRIYEHIFKPGVIKAENKEVVFYTSFLQTQDIIFDIGAYDGHKTAAFLKIAKKVVCIEPDPLNFKILQVRFRNHHKKVFLENKAVSDVTGTAFMHVHHPASAFNTLSDTWKDILEKDNKEKWDEQITFNSKSPVSTITLDRLIEKFGQPGFIKIDVEGLEEKVLQGLSQKVPFLSFEALLPDGLAAINNSLVHIRKLDPLAMFNIAEFERLLFENFIPKEELEEWLSHESLTHFEIIVKMNV